MPEILHPILELSVLLPGAVLAYLPMSQYIRIRSGKLIPTATIFLLLLIITGGYTCYFFKLKTLWMFLPLTIIAGIFYLCSLKTSVWKSFCVFLAICAVFSQLGNFAKAVQNMLYPGNTYLWLSPKAALSFILLCWAFVLIAWYPATHAAKNLVEDEAFAQTWYFFWTLPLFFIGINVFMTPIYPDMWQKGRVTQVYLTVSVILFLLLLLFYAMFYLMATSLNKTHHLQQENFFLSMQQTQYNNLRTAIQETREARHDMRHHFQAMQGLINRQDFDALEKYLSNAQENLPNMALNLCENAAVDSIISHYVLQCKKNEIPCSLELHLPQTLPVKEIDLCLVLSNLFENALEASLLTKPEKRHIHLRASLYSIHMVLLSLENTYTGNIEEENGIFHSSKHTGDGIGTQSVRRIAEKNGGYCHFTYENGIFRADIMLR